MKKRYFAIILSIILVCSWTSGAFASERYKKADLQALYDKVSEYVFDSKDKLAVALTEEEDSICAKTVVIAKTALLSSVFPGESFDDVYHGLDDAYSLMMLTNLRRKSLGAQDSLDTFKKIISRVIDNDYYEIVSPDVGTSVTNVVNETKNYIKNPSEYSKDDLLNQMSRLFVVLIDATKQKLKVFNEEYGVFVFEDINQSDWYFSAVKYIFNKGVFNGTSATEFSPNLQMTRAMFITALARFAGKEDAITYNFSDASTNAYYSKAVGWAHRNGILTWVKGNLLKPDQPITREEMITSIYNYIATSGKDISEIVPESIETFSDFESISDFAKDAIGYAYTLGIVKGYEDGSIKPRGTATRAEVAQVFINLDKRIGE